MKNYLLDNYRINEIPFGKWPDPDGGRGTEIYDDLSWALSRCNKQQKFIKVLADSRFICSTDYLGPSRHYALKAGLSEKEIIAYLKVTRTIGGHTIWPKSMVTESRLYTINQARGGRGGLSDRIDSTLFCLKEWFNDSNSVTRKGLKKSFTNYQVWFDNFIDFADFISFFKLEMFLDKDEIIDLVKSDLSVNKIVPLISEDYMVPHDKAGYQQFVNNVNALIKMRTLIFSHYYKGEKNASDNYPQKFKTKAWMFDD
ncbi:hypothetical protein PT285_06630 [Lactobacillus sp. ESL0791]|uniref:DUF6994 family protein n=1 Tax=Lactobacillus sp. ESL0791 TaxID=2983234 RepID=UPI0023F9BA15|nr:hypothetical protein [Lactobacillus sp. ESL0791]MDF7639075.1 hypothetical protein [Lactobacillus sp. ESL0791]